MCNKLLNLLKSLILKLGSETVPTIKDMSGIFHRPSEKNKRLVSVEIKLIATTMMMMVLEHLIIELKALR